MSLTSALAWPKNTRPAKEGKSDGEDEERKTKGLQMKSLTLLNTEIPMGLINKSAPNALTLNTVLPHRFTTFNL